MTSKLLSWPWEGLTSMAPQGQPTPQKCCLTLEHIWKGGGRWVVGEGRKWVLLETWGPFYKRLVVFSGHSHSFYVISVPLEYILTIPPHCTLVIITVGENEHQQVFFHINHMPERRIHIGIISLYSNSNNPVTYFHWKILALAGIWTQDLPATKRICYQLSYPGLDFKELH